MKNKTVRERKEARACVGGVGVGACTRDLQRSMCVCDRQMCARVRVQVCVGAVLFLQRCVEERAGTVDCTVVVGMLAEVVHKAAVDVVAMCNFDGEGSVVVESAEDIAVVEEHIVVVGTLVAGHTDAVEDWQDSKGN